MTIFLCSREYNLIHNSLYLLTQSYLLAQFEFCHCSGSQDEVILTHWEKLGPPIIKKKGEENRREISHNMLINKIIIK